MQTLKDLKKIKPGPYPKPIRLQVIAVGKPRAYGEDKELMNVAFADNSEIVKGVCFDKQKFPQFTEESGVVLRNIIMKQDEVIITKQSSVFKCKEIEVTEELRSKAREIIYPPLPSLMTINEAKKSPTKERVRIRAKVISEDLRTTRTIRTGEVPLRTITLADQDDTVKVALWRDMADADVRPGDHIEITNVVINNYQNQIQLQTTQLSSIQKLEPATETKTIQFLGVSIGDVTSEIMSMEEGVFTVNTSMLTAHFDCEQTDLDGKFPCELKVSLQEKIMSAILS